MDTLFLPSLLFAPLYWISHNISLSANCTFLFWLSIFSTTYGARPIDFIASLPNNWLYGSFIKEFNLSGSPDHPDEYSSP